jgi:hypothetical protein
MMPADGEGLSKGCQGFLMGGRVPLGKLSLAAIVTPLLHLLPDPAPRLNGDQRSDSCRHKGKPNKYHQVKIAGLRQNGFGYRMSLARRWPMRAGRGFSGSSRPYSAVMTTRPERGSGRASCTGKQVR